MMRSPRVRWLVPVCLVLLGACAEDAPTAPDRIASVGDDPALSAALDSIHSISAGGKHACGLDVTGAAFCWGANDEGQLGRTTAETCNGTACSTRPLRVLGGRQYTSVSAGGLHSCGVETGTGRVYCWGDGGSGQIGNGDVEDDVVPRRAFAPGVVFTSVSAGFTHTCALASDGGVWCWGYNGEGAVGGSGLTVLAPRRVGTRAYSMVSAGDHHTCAIGVNGLAYCWGANSEGQVGDTLDSDTTTTPRRVSGRGGYTWIAAGATHSCGVRGTEGDIYCWGANYFDMLGRTRTGGPQPTRIAGGRAYDQVTAGGLHTCGRETNGHVTCWGFGGFGQMGNGGSAATNAPARVPGTRTYATIDAGQWFTCATDGNGSVFCWGINDYGQIGRTAAATSSCGGIPCVPSPRAVRGTVEFAASIASDEP